MIRYRRSLYYKLCGFVMSFDVTRRNLNLFCGEYGRKAET